MEEKKEKNSVYNSVAEWKNENPKEYMVSMMNNSIDKICFDNNWELDNEIIMKCRINRALEDSFKGLEGHNKNFRMQLVICDNGHMAHQLMNVNCNFDWVSKYLQQQNTKNHLTYTYHKGYNQHQMRHDILEDYMRMVNENNVLITPRTNDK